MKLFMAGSKSEEADKMEHIAAILTNVTRLKPGRALLLEPGRGFIEALVAQLKSSNLLRRQGCAAAFRNCCFSAEVRKTLSASGLAVAMLGDSAVSPTPCKSAFNAKKIMVFAKMLDIAQFAIRVQTIWQTSCSNHDHDDVHGCWLLWLLWMRGKLR